MKKVILTIALFIALFFTANTASAKGIIFYSTGEKIEVIEKFPSEITIDEDHVNLGVMYDQFSIFWIPVWNYGETKHVLINDKEDTYWDVDEETIEILKTDYNIIVPEKATISFWNKIGGKLVWILVIVVLFALGRGKRKDNDEVETPEQSTETEN